MTRRRKVSLVLAAAIALLFVPAPGPPQLDAPARPFVWGQQEVWQGLERQFVSLRAGGCDGEAGSLGEGDLRQRIEALARAPRGSVTPGDLAPVESAFFEAAAHAAACRGGADALARLRLKLRAAVMEHAAGWEASDRVAAEAVYRLLYGSRMAVEEAWLQAAGESAGDPLLRGPAVASRSPAATVAGVEVRSGDILVSRGGAPTSAFIARGNDFPGNFSHIALVYVDERTGEAVAVESHIEVGVVVSSAEQYLRDRKLRVLVLRPDLSRDPFSSDPEVPHRAATRALADARARHIAYDFAMDHEDPDTMFCSEVASAAYRAEGVELWWRTSTFSSPGLGRWMAALGVRHLETLSPSDLEYDPRLAVVAEWHDPSGLWQDHLDNAAIDALLERADDGLRLRAPWWTLAPARVVVAYSALRRALGSAGPVPEGMSAAAALRVDRLRALFAGVRRPLEKSAEAFVRTHGYRPPYWTLVAMAREIAARATE